MTAAFVALGLVAVVSLAVFVFMKRAGVDAKFALKEGINNTYRRAEDRGRFKRLSAFWTDYHDEYPEFAALEKDYKVIREECERLLEIKDRLVNMDVLGGGYTESPLHTASWKTFVFKSGEFIEENCALAPRTAELLKKIPGIYTAFFSVVEPHQFITPHWGYYKGFLRYHMGVVIPNNNEDHCCYVRVNASREDNDRRFDPEPDPPPERSPRWDWIENGEHYYWKNGEGVMFDDTFLHEAKNDSDEPRVVLWIDAARKMTPVLNLLNRICLYIAHRDGSVKRFRENAVVVR